MFSDHNQVLIAQRNAIVNDLDVKDVFTFLRSKFVLTEDDEDVILGEKTRRREVEKLLDILLLKGDDAFKWFLSSLEEKYPHLVCYGVDNGEVSNQGCSTMSQYHRDLLTSKRPQIVDDLLVDDILPYLMGQFVFNDDDQQQIHAKKSDRLKAEKCLDLLATRGDKAFGHFVDSLRKASCEHIVQHLVTDDQECPIMCGRSDGATSIKREAANIRSNLSKERNKHIVLGEIVHLVRKPVVPYVKRIVETWHERLRTNSIQIGTCKSPENCFEQKRVQDLCPSCYGWYSILAANHRSEKESRIRWRQNCNTSKWENDPWEVAKFFMSPLGENKNNVRAAESTDLISLLNVLEWMKDEAFGDNNRIPIVHITKLREVRNKWAHPANQEITEDQINYACKVADEFLEALSTVSVDEDVTDCRSDIQSLVTDDSKKFQSCGDMSQVNQYIPKVENMETVDNLRDEVKLIRSRVNKVRQEVKRRNDVEAKEAKDKSYLPEKLSSFIGRTQEIEKAISLFREKTVGVVSIVGGPGIGKSTTAIEIAHGLNNSCNIPVSFAYLRGATTTYEVIRCLCHAMGVQPQQDPKSSLIFYLRRMEENCVLVMDNIEHLLEETTQDEFIALLRDLRTSSDKQLQILLTSRSHFDVSDLKCEVIPLVELSRNFSIQLVRTSHPGKFLTDQFLDSLAENCGDVPLALRIAASRLQDVSDPDELLQWLQDDPIEVLKNPIEKVEKSIEMSFNRLQNQEKNCFVRLSVFDGNFDKKAVQEIIAGLEGIYLHNFLTSLVNKSLMERRGERYSIHTLIRSYLIKRGESDEFSPERKLSLGKMVKHFLNLSHKLTLLYWSKDGSTKARRMLQEDAHNVKKALLLCQESMKEPTNEEIMEFLRESKIFQSSCRFFYHFVLHILSQPLILSFLHSCAKLARKHKDAGIELLVQCLISHKVGRTRRLKSPEYVESIKVAKETYCRNEERLEEKCKLEASSYYWYSQYMCNKESSSAEKANLKLQRYLEMKKNEGQNSLEEVDVAITLLQLARVHSQSEATKSIDCYKEALGHFESLLGNHDLKLCCHKELGDLHHEQGDHKEAVSHYEDAMEVHRKLGASNSNISSVYLLKNYGVSLSCMSRMEEGIEYQRQALDNAQNLFPEDPRCRIEVCCGLAEIFDKHQNGCIQAVEYAQKALDELNSNCYMCKRLDLKEKMSKIIERGNQSKPE